MITRNAYQVAKRAVVLGALSFRASLEVTQHARVREASEWIIPWLKSVRCDDELSPIERDLLNFPPGELPDTLKIDANWADEQGMFYCWTLGFAEKPPPVGRSDSSVLQKLVPVLRREKPEILVAPTLRETVEIEEMCVRFVLVKTLMREGRIPQSPGREIVRRLGLHELLNVGLSVTNEQIAGASAFVTQLGEDERVEAAGVYFVRSHAALWLFQS